MTLVLEIEYLAGIAFAARGPDSDAPDWPPQPDRIFSALVATWGTRREQSQEEANAPRWLEKESVPLISVSRTEPRTAPAVYVPPNDIETPKGIDLPKNLKNLKRASGVIPALRERKERSFPASRPHDPVVRFYWEGSTPDVGTFEILMRLAADTSYIGHSASLTRCRFLCCESAPPASAEQPRRRIYAGRFDELCDNYKLFIQSSGKVGRPQPGAPVTPRTKSEGIAFRSYFSPRWLVLEHVGGEMPDIRAAALVAKEIRDTLLSGYSKIKMEDRIPAEVSGHSQDGSPTREPHLSIVPLAFAGYTYADGHMLGFALIPPRNSGLLENNDFLRAMRSIAPFDSEEERRTLQWNAPKETLRLRRFGLKLSPTLDPDKKSLDSIAYTKPAFTFGTVTPIVLDRHLKEEGAARQEEIIAQIKSACVNTGLPEPSIVVPDKHSAIEGAPSAQPSGKAPEWMRWQLPSSLANRFLTHAVIRFSEPVEGPVILGAGRFVGLGLCRPMDHAEDLA